MIRRVVLALPGPVFISAGLLHFITPGTYRPIMPDYLPAHDALIYASGVAEIAGGVGLMSSNARVRRGAMWWLLATLAAVFPANVNMALNADKFRDIPGGRVTLIARLPFQLLFGWWVLKAGKRPSVAKSAL